MSPDISENRNTVRKHVDPKCMKFHLHRVIRVQLKFQASVAWRFENAWVGFLMLCTCVGLVLCQGVLLTVAPWPTFQKITANSVPKSQN